MLITGMLRKRLQMYGRRCLLNAVNNSRSSSYLPGVFQVLPEVSDSLAAGKPVVALESAILTHGMPYPENIRTARKVEDIVRGEGATPATIAIVKGRIQVGLTKKDLLSLANDTDQKHMKVSRRDYPYILSKGLSGGATVSGCMIAANRNNIPLFVTGGIGGVHRGAEDSFDVSTDLTELGKTPVMVVSAGVKSILDIGKTLEYLETMGVCVVTYGPTRDFPAFFTATSGYMSPYNVETPEEAAELYMANMRLGVKCGILLAVPIPADQAADAEMVESAIRESVEEARKQNVVGYNVTPFILKRTNEKTQGASLRANVALLENNARIGTRVAVALARLQQQRSYSTSSANPLLARV